MVETSEVTGSEFKPVRARYSLGPNVMVVARTRIEGAWSAYCAAVQGQSISHDEKFTLDNGSKLPEKIARAIFEPFEELKYVS